MNKETRLTGIVVADFIAGSGMSKIVCDIYEKFPKNINIDIVSFCNSDDYALRSKKNGWGFYKVFPSNRNPIKQAREFIKIFRNRKYDFAHFNYSSSWSFLPVILAKYYRTKRVIIHSHNIYFSKKVENIAVLFLILVMNFFGKVLFSILGNIKIATSEKAYKWLFLGRPNGKNSRILKNGIDVNQYIFNEQKRSVLRNMLGISSETILFGFTGTLVKRKNPIFALSVFRNYLKENPNSFFLIFGDGMMKREIKDYAKKNKIENKIKLMGIQTNINDWYSAMDVFLFPSIYEGFGLVALEASCNGLNVYTSNFANIPFELPLLHKMDGFKENEWVRAINHDLCLKIEREHCYRMIENYGFSINDTSSELLDLLLNVEER